MDVEEHVCQSCGTPMSPEDYVEGSDKGDFCHFCMVHGDFVADKEQVKSRLADKIQKDRGASRGEALSEADETLKGLARWQ